MLPAPLTRGAALSPAPPQPPALKQFAQQKKGFQHASLAHVACKFLDIQAIHNVGFLANIKGAVRKPCTANSDVQVGVSLECVISRYSKQCLGHDDAKLKRAHLPLFAS